MDRFFLIYGRNLEIQDGLNSNNYSDFNCKHMSSFSSLAQHPCSNHNGYCTHLCLSTPTRYQCACPDEDDGRICSTTPVKPTTTEPPPTTKPTTPVDYCVSQPCLNGGRCKVKNKKDFQNEKDREVRYKCQCSGYHGGENCEIDIGKLKI